MKKILITANTDRHIKLCHLPYIQWFKENGYEVDIATNTDEPILNTNKINLGLKRNPFNFQNVKAIFKLKKILDIENYELIHVHTPVGAVITRIAYKLSKSKAKLIYTCHGFHFYKKSPFYYWILFYPIEKYLMKYTDILLVMNQEDYNFAKKHFKNVKVELVNGVGFNKERFDIKNSKKDLDEIYNKYNINKNSFIVSYVAEYSKRKQQLKLIKNLKNTDIDNTNIKILLIGDDILKGKVQKTIKRYNLENSIKTIDFTEEINKFLDISNLVISVSRQEGLPLNILEAIYKKKIIIASNCRGNIDLVKNNINGFVIQKMDELYPRIKFVKQNYSSILKRYNRGIDISKYTSDYVLNQVVTIYKEIL